MSCITYQRMISQLVDGELHDSATEEVRSHMNRCDDCRTFYERLLSLNEDFRVVGSVLPNTALAERVKDRIASLEADRTPRQWIPSWVQLPLVAAVLLCALGIGNYAGRSLTELLVSDTQQRGIELLVMENGQSFADVILDIGQEESAQ